MKRRIFLTALTLAFTGAVAPGPMLVLVVGQVVAGGMFAVVPVLLGHAVIELVYITLLARGLGERLRREPLRTGSIVVGGLVLTWLGMLTVRGASDASLTGDGAAIAMGWWTLVGAGIGVSLSNPYFTGWWATVGSGQLAALNVKKTSQYLLFMLGHEMGDVLWYGFIALVLGFGRHYLSDTIYRRVVFGCGTLVIAMGLGFIAMGARNSFRAYRS
jgi:threonine/homoserine/homoserine lactone efflux protein